MPVTPAQARALVKKRGVLLLVPDFVEAVAGEKVKGSWWGHPKGGEIFRLAEDLEDSGDVLVAKLVQGKTTFVHRALWPSVLALVQGADFRAKRLKKLSPAAKKLLAQVEQASVRGGTDPKAVKELEASLLVHVLAEHTESGRHEKRLTSWDDWAKARKVKAAKDASALHGLHKTSP